MYQAVADIAFGVFVLGTFGAALWAAVRIAPFLHEFATKPMAKEKPHRSVTGSPSLAVELAKMQALMKSERENHGPRRDDFEFTAGSAARRKSGVRSQADRPRGH